jgi:hypothetical protein
VSRRWTCVALYLLSRVVSRCVAPADFSFVAAAPAARWRCEPLALVDAASVGDGFIAYAAKLHPALLVAEPLPAVATHRDTAAAAATRVCDGDVSPAVVSYVANAVAGTDALFEPAHRDAYTPRFALVLPRH